FQAEDGIRDRNVTGVQTCALPIWFIGAATLALAAASFAWMAYLSDAGADATRIYEGTDTRAGGLLLGALLAIVLVRKSGAPEFKIGRASCRGRVEGGEWAVAWRGT